MSDETAHNGHIAKIAALPSFENICYFCRVFLVGKCVCEPQLRQYAGRYLPLGEMCRSKNEKK